VCASTDEATRHRLITRRGEINEVRAGKLFEHGSRSGWPRNRRLPRYDDIARFQPLLGLAVSDPAMHKLSVTNSTGFVKW
jgi:hypothetical protein